MLHDASSYGRAVMSASFLFFCLMPIPPNGLGCAGIHFMQQFALSIPIPLDHRVLLAADWLPAIEALAVVRHGDLRKEEKLLSYEVIAIRAMQEWGGSQPEGDGKELGLMD